MKYALHVPLGKTQTVCGLESAFRRHAREAVQEAADVVLHGISAEMPQPFRRLVTGPFAVGITTLPEERCTLEQLYPLLLRTLSNVLIAVPPDRARAHFVTPERGHFVVESAADDDAFFDAIYHRIRPLASATLVIDNIFEPDLERELWAGDAQSESIARAGRALAELDLLPPPFPLAQLFSADELEEFKRAYGVSAVSYGNFSARQDRDRFWMTASGVDKSKLRTIGRDILLVAGYDEASKAMRISVPPNVEPRKVSVDAIEHWLIYRENPQVGAILHVHAWLAGAPCTEMQYPCGTYELGRAVADLVRSAPDSVRAVVGQRNHGVTITGTSLDEIIARVSGSLVREIPMV